MPLFDALKPVTAKWTARYRRSPLPAFLAWWKAELVGMLPPRWQAWFQDRRETWLATIDGDELRFQREGTPEPFARFDLRQQADILRTELVQLLGRGPHPDRRLILAAPPAAVLLRSLQFPPAVEQNLRQVLSFEMDRQTPFKADQVYFDYHVESPGAGRQLRVDLALAPRAAIDALTERARALGLALDGVDVPRSDPSGLRRRGYNLLPEAARVRRSNPQLRLNLILGAAAVLLLVMAMQQSIANRGQALEALRANVEQARTEAREVNLLRNRLDTAVNGAGYLAEKKAQTPSVFRVLGDLSERLPDDTWLERMTFREGGLEVAGQSSESTKLIALLQESRTLGNPAFMGQISPDARTRKERFTLSARYDLREGADPLPGTSGSAEAAKAAANATAAEGEGAGAGDGAEAEAEAGQPSTADEDKQEEAADADATPAG
jgi:general secretion pathway protein L